jgi:ATP-dependent helicase IRC3
VNFVLLVDESFESLERRAIQANISDSCDDIPQPTSVTFIDYDDPFSLFQEDSDSPHIPTISPNAWVRCGDNIYVLECLGKGHLRVEPVEGTECGSRSLLRATIGLPVTDPKPHYGGYFTPAMSDQTTPTASPYMRRRAILRAENLRNALRGCDTFAKAKFARDGIWSRWVWSYILSCFIIQVSI